MGGFGEQLMLSLLKSGWDHEKMLLTKNRDTPYCTYLALKINYTYTYDLNLEHDRLCKGPENISPKFMCAPMSHVSTAGVHVTRIATKQSCQVHQKCGVI